VGNTDSDEITYYRTRISPLWMYSRHSVGNIPPVWIINPMAHTFPRIKKCVDIPLASHIISILNPSLSRRMQRRFACVRSGCVWYCILRDILKIFSRFKKKTHKFEMKLNREKKVKILESQRWEVVDWWYMLGDWWYIWLTLMSSLSGKCCGDQYVV